ncbi:MAG: SRPBCC domain-containing protein [Alphaproteobacteria bacterium]|nr:SRPBCC domain-containing protein [Alphaproteobacteria bacterium]
MPSKLQPDLSGRPHRLTVERMMRASAPALYAAWTAELDSWFAEPGETIIPAQADRAYFFYNRHDWGRDPHYGRFLALEQNRLIEMTWLTGRAGTAGAETVLRIELTPQAQGTHLKLTHSGFYDTDARDRHEQGWSEALEILETAIENRGAKHKHKTGD